MKNKTTILSIVAGIVVAGCLIAWLMLSGDKPVNVPYREIHFPACDTSP